jgi:hypothetical protein
LGGDFVHGFREVCALLTLLSLIGTASADKKSSLPDADAAFRQAVEASDIWSAAPIRMKLHIKIVQVKAGEIDADYEETWISARQWRSQFSSQGFNESSVGGDGQVWVSSDVPEKPLRVREFERALNALSQTVVNEKLKYTATVVPMKDKSKKLTCVVVDDKQRSLVEDCIDPDTGLLMQVRDIAAGLVFEYSDYKQLKGKHFPTTIGVIEGSRPVAVAQLVGFEEAPTASASFFEPPADAQSYKGCPEALRFPLGASGGKLVKQVNPVSHLPRSGRPIIHFSTTVFGVIGRDGDLHSAVLASTDKNIPGDEILQAIRQWHYEPFTVCGNPVEMPVAITVNLN